MAGKEILADFKGVVTAPGSTARLDSSCIEASNNVFDAPGVFRKRRGFSRQPGLSGGPIYSVLATRALGSNFLIHYGNSTTANGLKYGDGSVSLAGVSTTAGAVTRSRANRIHGDVCQKNHYLTSDEGTRRLESDLALLHFAGMPRGALCYSNTITGSAIANGYARAYRVTWHRKDADGVVLGGAPTSRTVATNASGVAKGAKIDIHVPKQFGTASTAVTTSYFWRLWASRTTQSSLGEPDDEMQLIAEKFLTAGEITAGLVAFNDDTPDAYIAAAGGTYLHTNTNAIPFGEDNVKQGVLNEDAPPPAANDVAYWRDRMWFADATTRPFDSFSLLAALADGDTVVIDSRTYTARAAPTPGLNEFQIATTLQRTMEGLAYVINIDASNTTCYAYVVTGAFPTVAVESRTFTALTVSSNVNKWLRLSTSARTIASDYKPNGLWFSKRGRADAVAPQNLLTVGATDSRILRVVALNDRLLVFSTSGVYQVLGNDYSNFGVYPLALSFHLMARECVAVHDQSAYAWCREGIIEVNGGGVAVVSAPIENLVETVVRTATETGISTYGFAIAYGRRHQVLFFYPTSNGLDPSRWLTFDAKTRAWSSGRFSSASERRSCGAVGYANDLLTLCNWNDFSSDAYLYIERNAGDGSDFKDTNSDAADKSTESSATFQWVQPDDVKAVHWQQLVISFDDADQSVSAQQVLPSQFNVMFETENGETATINAIVPSSFLVRVEIPYNVRRAQSLLVRLQNTNTEYMGINRIALKYGDTGSFPRRP